MHHDQQQNSASNTVAYNSHGLNSSSSSGGGYVAVLDDDVALHPLSLCQLVDELQADPQLFMATGGCELQCVNLMTVNFWV
jgi:hypothetical protein